MNEKKYIKAIIEASIDWFCAWYGKIKNKKWLFLLENTVKNILKKYDFDKNLVKEFIK